MTSDRQSLAAACAAFGGLLTQILPGPFTFPLKGGLHHDNGRAYVLELAQGLEPQVWIAREQSEGTLRRMWPIFPEPAKPAPTHALAAVCEASTGIAHDVAARLTDAPGSVRIRVAALLLAAELPGAERSSAPVPHGSARLVP